jgi:hypothetical protein
VSTAAAPVAVGEQGVIVALRLMIDYDRVVPEVVGAVRAAVLDAVGGSDRPARVRDQCPGRRRYSDQP